MRGHQFKSSDFLRSTQKIVQSSSCFVHLLSKRPNHEEDFFQILCPFQKVRTLIFFHLQIIPVCSACTFKKCLVMAPKMQRLLLCYYFQHNFLEFLFFASKYIYCPVSSEVLAFIPQTNYYSYAMLHKSSNFLFYAHISRTPAVCQNEGHCTK